MDNRLVAIILLNYNSYEDTLECVRSLFKIDYSPFRIIIVDNCSKDVNALKKDIFLNEHCDIVYSDNNGGFSAGNNIGMLYAEKYSPQYYLILNNDTTVEPDFLSKMVDCMNEYKCGMVAGCSKFYYDREKIDFRGGSYKRSDGYARYFNPSKKPEKGTRITFATGCLWLIKASVVKKIGLMDENYFMYGEDVEYCNRMIDYGFDIVYCDEAIIYHKISASAGKNSFFKQYYITRNALFNIKKFGTKKIYAYLKHAYGDVKEIIINKASLKATTCAWKDFLSKTMGKTNRF